jgi:putative ABC transport system permease protein
MTARERLAEYAMLKALGFGPLPVAAMIFGESMAIAVAGGAAGILLTFPIAAQFAAKVGNLFPVFSVSAATVLMQASAALLVGAIAACLPALRAARVRIVDGLRHVG